ncbi:MAG: hypothetical protein HRU05_13510 [Oceanospirillaceae bacterium]|nr:hypothetical protein [Oceanospirillaceae bacterium]
MDTHDLKREIYSGTISQCKIEGNGSWYTLSLFYVKEQLWVVLTRKRRGVRLFKNVEAAMMIAADLGFNAVTLIEPDAEK